MGNGVRWTVAQIIVKFTNAALQYYQQIQMGSNNIVKNRIKPSFFKEACQP